MPDLSSPNLGGNSWDIPRARLALPKEFWDKDHSVVTIAAPAGFGKSTLLRQWQQQAEARGRVTVRLVANTDDYDGDKLLIDLAKALKSWESANSESLLATYGDKGRIALIKAVLAELGAFDEGALLFIDDVHELLEKPAESVLRQLLRYQPARLMLALSGRSLPAAATSHPFIEGRLHRFTGDDLALTQDEISQLLEQHDIKAREKLVQKIFERTQGWPAVVRLIALTLDEEEQSQDDFVEHLEQGTQTLTDYLNEVFLARLPDHLYDFLLRLSLPRGFTASLAAAIAGTEEAGQLLDELERRAIPISRSGTSAQATFILHPLVRDYLLARLRHIGGETLYQTRDRALDWFVYHDQIDSAIEICLDANDPVTAAKLINQHASEIVQQYGRHSTYLYWINKLPRAVLEKHPEIRLKQAWSLDFVRRHEEAESIRDFLEQRYLSGRHNDALEDLTISRIELEQDIELQRCVETGLRDQAVMSTSLSRRWLSRWPEADKFKRATAHTVLAFCVKALSDYEEGLYHAQKAQSLARECRSYYILAWAHMLGISNLIKQGRYRQALRECDDHLTELDPHLGHSAPAVMMLHAMRAGLLYEFNELSQASDALGRGLTALVEQSSTDPMIMAYVTLARLQHARGYHQDAMVTLAEGEDIGRSRNLPRLAINLGAERIVLLLRYGELEQAEHLWQEMQHYAAAHAPFSKTLEDKSSRILARIALLKGLFTDSCELLAPSMRNAKRTGQKRKQVEILLLQALILHQGGDLREAFLLFKDALTLSIPEGYLRVFADEGKPMQELMAAYRKDPISSDLCSPTANFVDQLTTVLGLQEPEERPTASEAEDSLIEPLTSRELQILSRLQSGLPNRQLSDTLFITEGTLKWHLQNIYGKLGVGNRLAAVSKAQELNLFGS